MNIFTYIQHLYTAIVLCKCVLTYIFSNYYNIHKEGKEKANNKAHVCLESSCSTASTHRGQGRVVAHGSPGHTHNLLLLVKTNDRFATV